MALKDISFSLMTFPQQWDGSSSTLTVNILLMPVGDPTAPLGGGPKFAGTNVPLVVRLVEGLQALPASTTASAWSMPFVATPPPVAPVLFGKLRDQLVAKGISVTDAPFETTLKKPPRIKKSLPPSYVQAFPFEAPRSDDFSVGDGYGCALRAQAPGLNADLPKPDKIIAWGQIISYALRQPALAEALGVIYRKIELPVPAGLLADGGFIYVALDPSPTNPWAALAATPGAAMSYAARLPELAATETRPVFAATLMPVVQTPPVMTDALFEAELYGDGFAQIVHANQPDNIDAVTLRDDEIAPGTEAGIQLGWDDEQVTVWLNNQVGLLHKRAGSTDPPTVAIEEAPLGVQGYRVDVRHNGEASWESLCMIGGTLPFDHSGYGAGAITSLDGDELWLTPAPVRPAADNNSNNQEASWLPLYFAQWNGSSLVLADPVIKLLAAAVKATNTVDMGNPLPSLPPANPFPDLTQVPALEYGKDYEFRVRLVDLTGGGPKPDQDFVHKGPAPSADIVFRRFVPPKALEVVASPPLPGYPEKPPPVRTIKTLEVRRPRISYPEAVFAGVARSTFDAANLSSLIQDAWASGRAVSVPDPDVDSFEVRVEARIPAHDSGRSGTAAGDVDDGFRVIYSVELPFPADAGDDLAVTLDLDYTDGIDDIATVDPPPDGTTRLIVPTARDIRVRLYPRCGVRPNYYGTDEPPIGAYSDYIVRKDAAAEDTIFPDNPTSQLQAFYFQPGSNVPQLLAQQLGLNQQGLTFSGATGGRFVFGASGGLRYHVAADAGSITISNQTELLGHWVVALVLDIERDWTWDGFAAPALKFSRDGTSIGTVSPPRVVATEAAGNPGQVADRSRTRVVFLDAINPHPADGAFPDELNPNYTVTALFDVASSQQFSFSIRLPITTPPNQTPKIVSTGIAETNYKHSDDYSRTELRDRYLWIEFDKPLADENDAYFGRVLAYGPDPLLAADLLPKSDPASMLPEAVEPALPIDPEPVRRIFSGQSEDFSGLDAMTQLMPAAAVGVGASGTFFLLPLPSGLTNEDLALFGFWTYEFRVGHVGKWTTAQGRYGRPLRVTGIQHPSPHLVCAIDRNAQSVKVTAPYAVTVSNGTRVYDFLKGDPQTRIWFMLYAQVMRADGESYRNILLEHSLGHTLPNPKSKIKVSPQHAVGRDPRAGTEFTEKDITQRLSLLGLPPATSLSVLAVELLPGPLNVRMPEGGKWRPDTNPFSEQSSSSEAGRGEDPLGADLGLRRILRTSPLTAIPPIC